MSGTAQYSVIVPAYKEASNLRPLATRIFAALRRPDSPVPAQLVEVIVVDDNSRDGSVEVVHALQQEGYNVRIIVRTTERGLSSAVVRGFQEAVGDNLLCMDADLQVSLFSCTLCAFTFRSNSWSIWVVYTLDDCEDTDVEFYGKQGSLYSAVNRVLHFCDFIISITQCAVAISFKSISSSFIGRIYTRPSCSLFASQ